MGYYAWTAAGQWFDVVTTMRFDPRHERNLRILWLVKRPLLLFTVKEVAALGLTNLGDVIYRYGVRTDDQLLRIIGRGVPVVVGALGFGVGLNNELTVPHKRVRLRRRSLGREGRRTRAISISMLALGPGEGSVDAGDDIRRERRTPLRPQALAHGPDPLNWLVMLSRCRMRRMNAVVAGRGALRAVAFTAARRRRARDPRDVRAPVTIVPPLPANRQLS